MGSNRPSWWGRAAPAGLAPGWALLSGAVLSSAVLSGVLAVAPAQAAVGRFPAVASVDSVRQAGTQRVVGTGGSGVCQRSLPSISAPVVGCLAAQAPVTVQCWVNGARVADIRRGRAIASRRWVRTSTGTFISAIFVSGWRHPGRQCKAPPRAVTPAANPTTPTPTTPSTSGRSGSRNARLIADAAEASADGMWGDWCKVFVNNAVRTGIGRWLGGYQTGYAAAGAHQVTAAQAARGDIVQVTPAGSTDATAERLWSQKLGKLHSMVILANLGGGNFLVIDSNWTGAKTVLRHQLNPYVWGAGNDIRIWRF